MVGEVKEDTAVNGNSGKKDELQIAADYGIDVSLLISNLQKTPAERIRLHQIALNTADKLRKAKHL
jgi:hypothetical protein